MPLSKSEQLKFLLKLSTPLLVAYAFTRAAEALSHRVWPRRRQSPGQLTSTVSFASRLIAAYRALESQEPDAVFVDPLAAGFAGRAALKRAARHCTEEYASVQPGKYNLPPAAEGQPRRLGAFTIRTLYFDQAILAACSGADIAPGIPLGQAIKQVVMLGAGMDARPWRLRLPDAVRWFEVDQADVIAAKRAALQELFAALTVEENKEAWFTLKAASLKLITADLTSPDWTAALLDQGFDPAQPTVWHAEGLLNYLTADQICSVLTAACEVSAPGSLLLCTMISASHTSAQRADTSEAHALEIAHSRKWGAPRTTAKIGDFFRGCRWEAAKLDEVARVAPELAPGFSYNCGGREKLLHDFQYWFMVAQPLL